MRKLAFFCAIAGLFAAGLAASAQSLQPNTVWRNERGSELRISSIDPDGPLRGSYINRATGYRCQNTPYPVVGWVSGDKIAFAVRWTSPEADCGSITSWTGYLSEGRLVTSWDLVRASAQDGKPQVLHGADVFSAE